MANATFYYPSKDGQSLYATANEWFARKQFKRRRQSPVILGTLPQQVVAKFKPKFTPKDLSQVLFRGQAQASRSQRKKR